MLCLLKSTETLSEEKLAGLSILMSDFQLSLASVQPSAKREGFATVPDVTWEDVGALQDVREELTMAILVNTWILSIFNFRISHDPFILLSFIILLSSVLSHVTELLDGCLCLVFELVQPHSFLISVSTDNTAVCVSCRLQCVLQSSSELWG